MTTRGPVRFRQREASRAVRAAEQAGLTVERLEVSTDGKISVYTVKRPAERGQETEADDIVARLT